MHVIVFVTALTLGADSSGTDRLADLARSFAEARRLHDSSGIEAVQVDLLTLVKSGPDGFTLRALVAETYLERANFLRVDRTIRDLDRATVKKYRSLQASWGEEGLPHAEKARELANTPLERATAERLMGELYVHQISGPIAGFRYGPRAFGHVKNSLRIEPENPECRRAQGLMFLYNPPINGGNVDLAVRTFRRCIESVPDSDVYHVYLSLAFRKKGNFIRSELAARKALRLNPHNVDAKHLIEEAREREMKRISSQRSLKRKLRSIGIGCSLAILSSGCLSLAPLRERDFDSVTIRHLEKAAYSDDARVIGALVELLEKRLEDPASVDLDRTLEALISLMKLRATQGEAVVRRAALEDTDEEVRYVALDALKGISPNGYKETLRAIALADASDLVREHARELLGDS